MELRDEVLSNSRAQEKNTNVFQVSDLEDMEFYREDLHSNMNAVFWPIIHTPFFLTTFDGVELGSILGNRILINTEVNMESWRAEVSIQVTEKPT